MGAETKARWYPGRYVPRVFWSLAHARDIRVAVRKADLRRLVELGVVATSNFFRFAGPLVELGVLAMSNLFRSAGPLVELGVLATSNLFRSAGTLLELGVLAASNLCRSAEPRTGVRSSLFRSFWPVGRSSLFRPTEPRGWVGVTLDFSLSAASVLVKSSILEFSAASLLVKSSKPMDFLEHSWS
jgi:hypothetical protein